MHACMYGCMHMHICMHVSMCIHIYIYIYICVYVNVCMNACVHHVRLCCVMSLSAGNIMPCYVLWLGDVIHCCVM